MCTSADQLQMEKPGSFALLEKVPAATNILFLKGTSAANI